MFGQGLYFGTVTKYNDKKKLWRIIYDDNDSEDFDKPEIVTALQLYDREKKKDPINMRWERIKSKKELLKMKI